jgi:Transketolase, thiamine diphosphate binding domain
MTTEDLDQLAINTIRTLSIDAVQQANSGHPGTPMALAPLVYTLWNRVMRFDPKDPIWPDRDRFVLSNGHASMLLWSVLHLTGTRAVNAEYERLGEPSVRLHGIGGASGSHFVDAVLVDLEACSDPGGDPVERAGLHGLVAPDHRRLDREVALLVAEIGATGRAIDLQRAVGKRLRETPQLCREMTLRRQAHLAERALAQLDLAEGVRVLPVDERERDPGTIEQAGAHLVLHDAALGEHPHEIEVVDREPGIAPDRRAREAGIGAVGVAAEDDVPVVIGEEEFLAVLARDPPDRRELRRLLVEMRPHGGSQALGHGTRKGWREVDGSAICQSPKCALPSTEAIRRRRSRGGACRRTRTGGAAVVVQGNPA